ncbi:MAG: Penicillin-binding protein, 1A family [Candidatus Levybacteria bacterium GW2011_GWB1_39_7]|nr:MAG: Penicillin-binding protein, 1A family [Candidatus Levybacteria bacterium GW2011_GWB1_39_7]KKR26059.1 MAG: Penicillin-binding protein, 1A family [Microgenomates group bacterium GW2011_GWC1_39_7]KKR49728.1 MAG: Penicillin-binding protein, 1A family [Candidatus Levybacteria bacterium GW2011_GWA2_40_16]
MYILGKAINLIVLALIAIGDFVLLFFRSPFNVFGKERPARSKKTRSGTFKLPKKNRKSYSVNLLKLLFRIARGGKNLFSKILIKKRIKAQRKRNRAAVLKQGNILRPSFGYKLKYVFIGSVFSFVFLFIPLLSYFFVSDLPSPGNLSVNYIPKTTKIYDRKGALLYEVFANQNRTVVRLSDVPKDLRDATIAIEDKDFYAHPGFDLRGITRAFITNIRKEGFQGGSTITQQLIKSAFLTPEPTIIRKVKEVALAFWAERIYSKDEILELYLNYVPYGGTAWGIQAAGDVYFGKKVKDLTLAESAFLAGLPRAPSVYSPFFGNGHLWKVRQKEVLDAMGRLGYITSQEAKKAYDEELVFRSPQVPIRAPHFVMYLRKLLIERYGLSEVERGGLQIYTTLDLEIQKEIEKIVAQEVEENSGLNIGNGAALVTIPSKGDILAMVGSKNYFDEENDGNVNLTTSLRQPGSAIKLVTYALALSQGYTEATILDDTPLTIRSGTEVYTPVNYDGAFHGKIPLRIAFANSFNIPPVRLAQKFGPDNIKSFGEKMGLSSWRGVKNYGISITLGGLEVKMTDMATIYGAIANNGRRVELDPVLEVKDFYGKSIYKKEPLEEQVVDPGIAFIISDILADNNARRIEFGLNTPLSIPGRRVSVKTGTTDNKRDNWTIGFTPDVLVATWVGNNNNTPMNQALASGITGAAPMWNKIIAYMLSKTQESPLVIPSEIVKKYCLGQDRYFVKGTENSVNCRGSLPSVTPSPAIN